jgi:hypothetical protein
MVGEVLIRWRWSCIIVGSEWLCTGRSNSSEKEVYACDGYTQTTSAWGGHVRLLGGNGRLRWATDDDEAILHEQDRFFAAVSWVGFT